MSSFLEETESGNAITAGIVAQSHCQGRASEEKPKASSSATTFMRDDVWAWQRSRSSSNITFHTRMRNGAS